MLMIRMQFSLAPDEYRLAKREAARRGISLAEFVRLAVREELNRTKRPSWMRYCEMVESGDRNSGKTVDRVYDERN